MAELTREKIIAGRKAVDDYRTAHTELHSKPWHKGIPEEHTPLLNKLKAALKKQGFNSLAEFFDANDSLVKETVESSYHWQGECDGCPNRERGCESSCYEKEKIFSERHKRDVIPRFPRYNDTLFYLGKYGEPKADGILIPNCGFRVTKLKEPDIDWRWQ